MLGTETRGHLVVRRSEVSLRGPKEGSERAAAKLKNFRCPDDIDAYLRAASAQLKRDQTDIIVGAIELDRDLPVELGEEHQAKLKEFAALHGLSMDKHLAKILAGLVKKGLDCQDVDCGSAPKKQKK